MTTPSRRDLLAGAVGITGLAVLSETAAPAAAAPAARHRRVEPGPAKHQMRGMWIATVVNIDWPSKPGLPAAQQQRELIALYETALARGYNTVVLQVRPTADSFWPSDFEPWSKYLSGTQGKSPGYDPLKFAVREAHSRGLKIHGWFNPYRVSMDTDIDALVPTHPARQHPDWVVTYGPKLYYDPGIPAVRRFTIAAIMDAVSRYDLDGVHFDDYFYPYPIAGKQFPDDASYAAYGHGFTDRGDWRRDNINRLIRELARAIHRVKPHVQFGVSPFAVWRNDSSDPRGSATSAGAQCYDDLYADTRRWTREGWVDYIAPQIYWAQGFAPADYDVLVDWWARQVRSSRSHTRLFIGQATYKIGTSTQSPAWIDDPHEMSNHLTYNRKFPEVAGDIFYNATSVTQDLLDATSLVTAEHYRHPALVPTMPWLDHTPPGPVRGLRVAAHRAGKVTLQWSAPRGGATDYAIYRASWPRPRRHANDAARLVAVVPAGRSHRLLHWTDAEATDRRSIYAVTAVDRLGNESRPRRAR